MTMSGLFERIARRRATPPDETQELDAPTTAGPPSTGDEPAPTEVLASGEAPAAAPEEGVRSEAVAGEAAAEQSEAATNGEAAAEQGAAATNGEAAAEQSEAATNGEPPERSKTATNGEPPERSKTATNGEPPERSKTASNAETPMAQQGDATPDAPTEILAPEDPRPSFRDRGRVRRRVRYLRRLRELQLRDLGGLVFELRRFGRRREDLVDQKLTQLAATDEELRHLETLLADRRAVVELREPGIGGTCSNCGALHGSADHYCAQCGRPLDPGAGNGAATSEAATEPRAE